MSLNKVFAKDIVLGNTYYIDELKDVAGELVMRGQGSLFFKINWTKYENYCGGYSAPDGIIELSDFEDFYFYEKQN